MKQRVVRRIQAAIYFAVLGALIWLASQKVAHSQAVPDATAERMQLQKFTCAQVYLDLNDQAGRLSRLSDDAGDALYYLDAERELTEAAVVINAWEPIDAAQRLCTQDRMIGLSKLTEDWRHRSEALAEARERKRQREIDAMVDALLAFGFQR